MVPLFFEEERDRLMAWQLGVSLHPVWGRRIAKLKLPNAAGIISTSEVSLFYLISSPCCVVFP